MTNSTRKPQKLLNKRRGSKPEYDPLQVRAALVADVAWERSSRLLESIAPDMPYDTVESDPADTWAVLEAVAVNLSPGYWGDPDALEDLYKLRKQFKAEHMPGTEELPILAKAARASKKARPDPSITPQNPEYDRMVARIGAGGH